MGLFLTLYNTFKAIANYLLFWKLFLIVFFFDYAREILFAMKTNVLAIKIRFERITKCRFV